jgi:hypothetical protein
MYAEPTVARIITMRDPRLDNMLFQARHRQLVEQAARDRLAASRHTGHSAPDRLLAAAGAALIALGERLHTRAQHAPALAGAPAAEREDMHTRNGRAATKPASRYDDSAGTVSTPAGVHVSLRTVTVPAPGARCPSASAGSPTS